MDRMIDRWEQARSDTGGRLQALLDQAGLGSIRLSPADWWVAVPQADGERPLQVHVRVGDYTVFLTAFLIRAPRENVEDVYRLLLRRQAARTPIRFCLDEDGDVLLKAELPIERLAADELDRIVGSLLEQYSQTFWPILRLGFESFFQRPAGSTTA